MGVSACGRLSKCGVCFPPYLLDYMLIRSFIYMYLDSASKVSALHIPDRFCQWYSLELSLCCGDTLHI